MSGVRQLLSGLLIRLLWVQVVWIQRMLMKNWILFKLHINWEPKAEDEKISDSAFVTYCHDTNDLISPHRGKPLSWNQLDISLSYKRTDNMIWFQIFSFPHIKTVDTLIAHTSLNHLHYRKAPYMACTESHQRKRQLSSAEYVEYLSGVSKSSVRYLTPL